MIFCPYTHFLGLNRTQKSKPIGLAVSVLYILPIEDPSLVTIVDLSLRTSYLRTYQHQLHLDVIKTWSYCYSK